MSNDSAIRVPSRWARALSTSAAFITVLSLTLPTLAASWQAAGRVVDACGVPAPGATVSVTTSAGATYSTQADAGGWYSLSGDAPSGSTSLMQAQKGSLSSPVYPLLDQDVTMNLTLSGCQP